MVKTLLKLCLLSFLIPCKSYSLGVLTHEAIIDAEWNNAILPLLKSQYPSSTDSEFTVARAYAYGGAVTPDMGYYPFGSTFFTDLIHYVRSGDMTMALLKDANSLNSLAFALGFLSHYYGDVYGHPLATNKSVPLIYPKMKKKFGDVVTYADDNLSHIRTEFGFDVLETAKGNFAAKSYHDFIGFEVDTALLAKAFYETYGLNLDELFSHHLHLSVETFRFMVASAFPFITRVAWASKNKKRLQTDSTKTSKIFRYKMRTKQYNKDFGRGYKNPGFTPVFASIIIRLIPKFGYLRALNFKIPTAEAEKYFDKSFDSISFNYTAKLHAKIAKQTSLKDDDFDTGLPTEKCEYTLADDTYNEWLLKLYANNFTTITPVIKNNIANYYSNLSSPPKSRKYKQCDEVYVAYKALVTQ